MLKSIGSVYPRSLAERPDLREFKILAFMYAAAVMMPCAPANVWRTLAILYDPLEISFAISQYYPLSSDFKTLDSGNSLGSAGSSIDNKLCL